MKPFLLHVLLALLIWLANALQDAVALQLEVHVDEVLDQPLSGRLKMVISATFGAYSADVSRFRYRKLGDNVFIIRLERSELCRHRRCPTLIWVNCAKSHCPSSVAFIGPTLILPSSIRAPWANSTVMLEKAENSDMGMCVIISDEIVAIGAGGCLQ